jgi:23S rRNA pseudouridine2605 synthase
LRYGNLEMFKRLPQGAWIELDLENLNALRNMVQLPNETETKVHTLDKLDHTKLSRMRRSVRKHKTNKVVNHRQRVKPKR